MEITPWYSSAKPREQAFATLCDDAGGETDRVCYIFIFFIFYSPFLSLIPRVSILRVKPSYILSFSQSLSLHKHASEHTPVETFKGDDLT